MNDPISENPFELIQQGDVLFFQVSQQLNGLPAQAQAVPRVDRGLVIAEGELTGHAHVIEEEGAQLYSLDEILLLVVEEEVECRHEEHDTVYLPPGVYRVGGVREVNYPEIEARERRERLQVDVRSSPVRKEEKRRRKPKKTDRIDRMLEDRREAARKTAQREGENAQRKTRERERQEWRYVVD